VRRAPLLLLFAALALTSCGGGDDKEDVQDVLDKAFSSSIESANLKVDASVQIKGSPGLEKPLRLTATGPFRTNDGKLPSADIELKVGSDGGGQTITTGFLSTGDRAFLKFQDVYYEQPASQVAKANRSIARNEGKRGSLGTLEVEAVMRNLNRFVRKSGAALGGATGEAPPPPLSEADIRQVADVVRDPTFNVYVGEDDDIIRRVSGKIEFEVPEESRESLGGIESGAIEFQVEFSDVNGDQQIEAPARARPISDLTRTLGGGGTLPGLGDSQPESPVAPDDGNPDADAFQAYEDCLDKARPEDTDALQRCAELLQP